MSKPTKTKQPTVLKLVNKTTNAFALGDVVRLKSGGPNMTVCGIYLSDGGFPCVNCMWFTSLDAVEPRYANIMEVVLTRIND
jgi:uncharacterized protein YodC (DUF2158 family)